VALGSHGEMTAAPIGVRVMARARRLAYQVLHDKVLTPLGAGRPVDARVWQRFYGDGRSAWLATSEEAPRYAQVAAYAGRFGREAAILDVGCGTGLLVGHLRSSGYGRYLGLDYAPAAIATATPLEDASTSFAVGNLEDWLVPGLFDVIVFNESLLYARRPVAVLQRFACQLTERGVLVVSNYRTGNYRSLWRNVDRHFTTVEATTLRVSDKAWDIRVLGCARVGTR
jgi:2-polyprenyl-3-methyl-5-hydroxy-6-metoxy-1,4-benzoquinol methylase